MRPILLLLWPQLLRGELCVEVLIVGPPKSGTTALFSALVGSGVKELYYFNDDERYAGGDYAKLLDCDAKLVVDATPLYLVNAIALERAARTVPWTKWIALAREPVDRAYSHYNMLCRFEVAQQRRLRLDATPSSSFEVTIEPEVLCYENHSSYDACVGTPIAGSLAELDKKGKLQYFGSRDGLLSVGVLAPQIQRALKLHSQLIVVSQRALFDDGPATVAAILKALGRPNDPISSVRRYESLSDHTEFGDHPDTAFQGHRHRIDSPTLARLDALLAQPNRDLADLLLSPCGDDIREGNLLAIGFQKHDQHWLSRSSLLNDESGSPPDTCAATSSGDNSENSDTRETSQREESVVV